MEKFLRFLSGYVCICVEGEQLERFLNLCKSRGIVLGQLTYRRENSITGFLSVRHFFLLRPIRRKTGVHICVLEKYGLPFFFFRNKKRKAFFAGILLCAAMLLLLSSRIWNIHIEGNQRHTTPELLDFLNSEGITHGIAKNRVNCAQIAASIRRNYPEITWVSARMEGTRLLLTIQEGIPAEEEKEKEEPCSLSADVEGTIVKMITRRGIPLVQPGDTCKEGDLLVMGRLELRNDSQEVFRYEYVHADADIYVRHSLAYYYEFPLEHQKRTATGKSRRGFYLKLGNWFFGLCPTAGEGWDGAVSEEPWRITENFILPVSVGTIRLAQYEEEPAVYTQEQAKRLALGRLQLYEEKLIEKGVQISENNVKIEINQSSCVSRGTFQVIEKTGKEIPVELMEEPKERTSEDD